jgi:hypothetical protein
VPIDVGCQDLGLCRLQGGSACTAGMRMKLGREDAGAGGLPCEFRAGRMHLQQPAWSGKDGRLEHDRAMRLASATAAPGRRPAAQVDRCRSCPRQMPVRLVRTAREVFGRGPGIAEPDEAIIENARERVRMRLDQRHRIHPGKHDRNKAPGQARGRSTCLAWPDQKEAQWSAP